MKPTFNQLLWLIGICAVLFLYWDNRGAIKGVTNISNRDSTVIHMAPITVNVPPGKPTIVTVNVPANVDTGAIIQAYFSSVTYHDSLENDTVKINIHEEVRENRLASRQITWKLKLPIITIVETHQQKKNTLMLGGMATVGRDTTAGLSVMGGVITKRDRFYYGGYDLIGRRVSVGAMIPIKIKR